MDSSALIYYGMLLYRLHFLMGIGLICAGGSARTGKALAPADNNRHEGLLHTATIEIWTERNPTTTISFLSSGYPIDVRDKSRGSVFPKTAFHRGYYIPTGQVHLNNTSLTFA